MKNLISMVDFVLEQYEKQEYPHRFESIVFDYANFLKQPLELWMFIPCRLVNGVWVVLEEPKKSDYTCVAKVTNNDYYVLLKEYQEAKDRVLFEGFEVEKNGYDDDDWFQYTIADLFIKDLDSWRKYQKVNTIEDLLYKYQGKLHNPKVEFVLTPAALKQIGL